MRSLVPKSQKGELQLCSDGIATFRLELQELRCPFTDVMQLIDARCKKTSKALNQNIYSLWEISYFNKLDVKYLSQLFSSYIQGAKQLKGCTISFLKTLGTSRFWGLTKGRGLICSHLSLGWVVNYSMRNIPNQNSPPPCPTTQPALQTIFSLSPLYAFWINLGIAK